VLKKIKITGNKNLLFFSFLNYLTIPSSRYKLIYKKGGFMNTQFKKGVLELIVLYIVSKKDMYGYELVLEVSKILDVNEGTIYPLLKRLTNEKYFETYLKESSEGPPRKYYHITANGMKRKDDLKKAWLEFSDQVSQIIRSEEE